MSWPPKVGDLLPNGQLAWAAESKWEWILSEAGHGPEWARVFRVISSDADRIWEEIAWQVQAEPVSGVRKLFEHGLNCRVDLRLTIDCRTGNVRTVWHYASHDDSPRLVTAFPRL